MLEAIEWITDINMEVSAVPESNHWEVQRSNGEIVGTWTPNEGGNVYF